MTRNHPWALWLASVAVGLIAANLAGQQVSAATRSTIIAETTAALHGLTRPWFTQVQLDRSRARIDSIVLQDGTLFVQTNQAILQAIDAETGQTLWVSEVGRRGHPSMRPAVNGQMVAVVNGSYLYIVNRFNGKLLWKRQVDGAPGAGAALSDIRAYVPMTNGMVLAYRLEPVTNPAEELGLEGPAGSETAQQADKRRHEEFQLHQEYIPPLSCQSYGRTLIQPLVTRQNAGEEFVAWPTDQGHVFIGRINRKEEDHFEIMYRLDTAAGVAARPTYLPPDPNKPGDSGIIFAPSRDGFVHAIREKDGSSLWRFPTGEPVVEPAAVVGDRVYVSTQLGGMYCLESLTGRQLWWAANVMGFVAASKDRVYVTDRQGRIAVLHAESGGRLDTIRADGLPIHLMNLQTDRIYLASRTGLVQCLHEIEQEKPIQHRAKPVPAAAAPATGKPAAKKPAAEKPKQPEAQPAVPKPAENPFGNDNPFGGQDPFGGKTGGGKAGGAKAPAGGAGAGAADDPFGGNPFGR